MGGGGSDFCLDDATDAGRSLLDLPSAKALALFVDLARSLTIRL